VKKHVERCLLLASDAFFSLLTDQSMSAFCDIS
jgi:hypothetical protein